MTSPQSPQPRSRRRAAKPRRFRGDAAGLAGGALVLVAALAVALVMPSAHVSRPSSTELGTVVTHSLVACPGMSPVRGASSRPVAGVAPGPGLGGGGSVRQGPRSGKGRRLHLRRGWLVHLHGAASAPVLTGDGPLAAGLFGFRADRARQPDTLAVTPCPTPRASWWFTGAGAGLDHSSEAVLSNVDEGPAVVDLEVLGPDGVVDTVNTRGITIAPGTTQRIKLSDIAPQTDDLALGVQASRGRVVASVSDQFAARPGGPVGQEWLNSTAGPSHVVRLAGLPDAASARTLMIANPAQREAVVEVQVAGRDGQFVPSGLGEQSVAPGAIGTVELPKQIGRKEAVAVRLRSAVRILATVRSVAAGDTTYAAPVVPLPGPAAAPVVPGSRTRVQLTAGAEAAKVSVAAYDDRGKRLDAQQLQLPPTATRAWSPKRGAAYVVVTPVSGPVYGAAVFQGKGVSLVPLEPLPIRFVQPVVVPAVR